MVMLVTSVSEWDALGLTGEGRGEWGKMSPFLLMLSSRQEKIRQRSNIYIFLTLFQDVPCQLK